MKLFTIGFTQRSAEDFFSRLQKSGIKRIVDIRLHNTSQIAGFAKASDLPYFLRAIAGIDYLHETAFAPTDEILDAFKKKKGAWADYEKEFGKLMRGRKLERVAEKVLKDRDCLLCSEFEPDHCHRRLIAEYVHKHLPKIEVIHL